MALVFRWTTWKIIVFDGCFYPNWDFMSSEAVGFAILLVARWSRLLLQLVTRLPGADRRNIKRSAFTLVCGTNNSEDIMYLHWPLKRVGDIRHLQLMPETATRLVI